MYLPDVFLFIIALLISAAMAGLSIYYVRSFKQIPSTTSILVSSFTGNCRFRLRVRLYERTTVLHQTESMCYAESDSLLFFNVSFVTARPLVTFYMQFAYADLDGVRESDCAAGKQWRVRSIWNLPARADFQTHADVHGWFCIFFTVVFCLFVFVSGG